MSSLPAKFVWMANLVVVALLLLTGMVNMGIGSEADFLAKVNWVFVPILVAVLLWRGPRFLVLIRSADVVIAALVLAVPILRWQTMTSLGLLLSGAIEALLWLSIAVAWNSDSRGEPDNL